MFDQMTTGLSDGTKRWRDRAHERQMLGIARGYDRVAEHAEGRLRPTAPPEPSH